MEGLAQAVVASTLYIPSLSSIIIVHSYASFSWLITLQYNINVIVSDNDTFFAIKYKSPGLLFGLVVGHPRGAGDGGGDAGHSGAGHGGGSGTAGGSGSTSAGCASAGVNGRELEDTLPPPTPLQNTQLSKSTSSDMKKTLQTTQKHFSMDTDLYIWTHTAYYPYLCSLSHLPLHTDPLKSTDMASSCFV